MRRPATVVAIAGCSRLGAVALAGRDGGFAPKPPLTAVSEHAPATLHEGGGAATPPDQLAPLHAFEEARHRAADFAHLPPSDRALGPDPIAVRALPGEGPPRFVGLLRGRDALVLLDASLKEIARTARRRFPSGLAVADDGEVCVSGEQRARMACFEVVGGASRGARQRRASRRHGRAFATWRSAARAIGRATYAVDERTGSCSRRWSGARAYAWSTPATARSASRAPALTSSSTASSTTRSSSTTSTRTGSRTRTGARHPPRRAHLGLRREGLARRPAHRGRRRRGSPARPHRGLVRLHRFLRLPLSRRAGRDKADELAAVNVSEHGVVTPKAVVMRLASDGAPTSPPPVTARQARRDCVALRLRAPPASRADDPPRRRLAGPAGDTLVFADPLLDAWFSLPLAADTAPVPVPVPDPGAPPRSTESRVGEALFFTNLMAPWNRSEGRLSRFTCETCHFEGYVDGRTHHTGRGDVHATTKPLLGLFENRPHFSRALDPDMATMVNNEFRVAGALSGHDPWFSMAEAAVPWTSLLGPDAAKLDALGLRRALMTFLMDFNHRPNPAVLGREALTDEERRGMKVFARRCEGCHAARLVADDPATRVPARSMGGAGAEPRGAHRVGLRRVQEDGGRALRPRAGRAHSVVAQALREVALLHEWIGEEPGRRARARAVPRRRLLARRRARGGGGAGGGGAEGAPGVDGFAVISRRRAAAPARAG